MKCASVCPIIVCAIVASFSLAAFADDKNQPTGEKPKMADRVYVKVETSMGPITIELNAEKAPISVANFLSYVDEGFYKDTIFHRVMDNFMIQGGGKDKDGKEKKTKSPIKNEWQNGLKNKRGTIAMARTSVPDSATSQFYINVVDNAMLDMPRGGAAYAAFGKVIDGMDVIDRIKKVKVHSEPPNPEVSVPDEQIVVKDIVRIKAEEVPADVMAKAKAEAEEEAKKAAEEAKKAAEAQTKAWDEAMGFVKSRGGDTSKGTKTASGLWYVDAMPGTGPKPAGPTDTVKVHYTGWLTNGKKFDSSLDRGQPASFPLNQVIKGWTEGVGSMNVGTKRLLVIPPDLAYGSGGAPGGMIPPNSTLVFEVELLSINE